MEVVDDKKVELLIENIENTLAKVIEDLKATT
jgi:hypothetical protein